METSVALCSSFKRVMVLNRQAVESFKDGVLHEQTLGFVTMCTRLFLNTLQLL